MLSDFECESLICQSERSAAEPKTEASLAFKSDAFLSGKKVRGSSTSFCCGKTPIRMTKGKNEPQSTSAVVPLFLVFLFGFALVARGQESPPPEPTSPPPARSVRVSFLPPPLDGTISLGIYDAKGNLVRVLHREADIKQFKIGADALSTTWNGQDDKGENVPAGKYSAHGFVVGDLKVKGVGFFFNDWTTENSPRISRIWSIGMRDDKLLLSVEVAALGTGHVLYDVSQKTLEFADYRAPESTPSATPSETGAASVDPVMKVSGRNATRWVVDRTAKGATTTEVRQFSPSGELLWQLSAPPDQPQPLAIAVSMTEDKIYLLEESSGAQRVRGLSLVATKPEGDQSAVSDWKVDFEKWIVAHKDFSLADGKPVPSPQGGTEAPEKLKLKLQPNPLLNDARITVELAIGFDAEGSFLKSGDGLPLFSISETPKLTRALLAPHGSSAVDVFQDDGAVVEQFRVTGVDQMMSFDCGGFELK